MFSNRSEADEAEVAALAEADRITDPTTVYDDIDSLPEWWRRLVYEFAERDLRVYQPSRFADGEIVYEVVRDLEERFDVEIIVKSNDPSKEKSWKFTVDGTTTVLTTHTRKAEGFTRYGVTSEELVEAVEDAVTGTS